MVGKSQPVIVRLGLLTEQPVDIKASPGFDLSILRHSGIWGAADETVMNTNPKNPPLKNYTVL